MTSQASADQAKKAPLALAEDIQSNDYQSVPFLLMLDSGRYCLHLP
jgi:hypothetical protein